MKRCLFVWAFASVAMWGQDRALIVVPNSLPGSDQLQSFQNAFQRGNAFRGGKVIVLPDTGFQEFAPVARTCVVPLLAAPMNPNVDRKMVIHPPESAFDSAGIVKGLPPCSSRAAK